MPAISPESNIHEYTVSEIAGAVKRTVEDTFGYIRVRGEISGWKLAASGHAYLALKDENAVLDAVSWKGTVNKFGFKPEDGLEVVCTGRMTTYPGRSKYQLVIEHMEPAGVGALMALLEKRRKELEAEGLFRADRKKKLPFMPSVIGVVTSPTGAVIRDILHRIGERFPVHVIVWPVLVQGEGAAAQIAEAIRGFNALDGTTGIPRPDVLIVARGGGSLEDLWAFNEEIVVRAAAESVIPLISAVGHETDTTLIDFASDLRAPTPTAAAEFAVPVREEWQLTLLDYERRKLGGLQRLLERKRELLEALGRGLPRPSQILDTLTQRMDELGERLRLALPTLLNMREKELAVAIAGLRPQSLAHEILRADQRVGELGARMAQSYLRIIDIREQKLGALVQLLGSLNYTNVLARGYAMVKDSGGRLVSQATGVKSGETLTITFRDGEKKVRAE